MSLFYRITVFFLTILLFPLHAFCQFEISLEPFANGLNRPVSMAHAGDDRLFVVEKRGTIKVLEADGTVAPNFFLDIRSKVDATKSEKGLLGLVFHPDFTNNGFFYVNYTNSSHTVIARYSVDPGNEDQALSNSEMILLTQSQPFDNHNAGDIQFGPDGYLYIGLGDGGDGGDPGNRAQNMTTFLGKMLRIDIDQGTPYQVPADNPFVDVENILPEIWAFGLRNPWRFSFDRATGEMYIADVGQNIWEEINVQPAGSAGGQNYGWRCYEGLVPFNMSQCGGVSGVIPPVHVYEHSEANGCSVTGGYVYRGEFDGFKGKYIYCDFCSGQFWMLSKNEGDEWINEDIGAFERSEYSAFGEDVNGELYIASLFEGTIQKIGFPIVDNIEKQSFDDQFLVWPNPANDRIFIDFPLSGIPALRVFSQSGSEMKNLQWEVKDNQAEVRIAAIPPGTYFISISWDKKKIVRKFVKN
jgi:glucose/arabinose dehydrogenase